MTSRRIGLLGGSFNPPHLGHLKLAELALQHLRLDELWVLPNTTSPHKAAPKISHEDRLMMMQLTFENLGSKVLINDLELRREPPTYTIDTLKSLKKDFPHDRFVFIIGSDAYASFPTWSESESILTLCSLAIGLRPGLSLLESLNHEWSGSVGEKVRLPSTELSYASYLIRDALVSNRVPIGLLPKVASWIHQHGLYR